QTVELGIAALQSSDDPEALDIVIEAAVLAHRAVERILTGMAERRVAQVVRQGQCLGQVLIEPEPAGNAARDLRHLEAVRQPCAVVVALMVDEHLRLVLQAAEGRRMEDPVTIALKGGPSRGLRLRMEPPPARGRVACVACELHDDRHGRTLAPPIRRHNGFAGGNARGLLTASGMAIYGAESAEQHDEA